MMLPDKTDSEPDEPPDIARPDPSAMMVSLRAIGYSIATAIADLVDNSISAGARNTWIEFFWNGDASFISVTDDGRGMNEPELIQAMTVGSKRPGDVREASDLGRFGMGLKTASFSQCKRLTVRSKTSNAERVTREWELDYMIKAGDWLLKRRSDSEAESALHRLNSLASGTSVLWRSLDRVVPTGTDVEDASAKNRFLKLVSAVDEHLAMTFHRFLPGKLKLFINNRPVDPWDPFLSRHDFTQESPVERITTPVGDVLVKGFVLPHHSKLTDELYDAAAGPKGWSAQQGLYIYRNNRLLVSGGWTGLGLKREEQFKLARISIDIPNTNAMDLEWELDIKKSRARPPAIIAKRLKELSEVIRERAKQTFRARGTVLIRTISKEFAFVWQEEMKDGKVRYRVNRDHPLVKRAIKAASEEKRIISLLLQVIEESLPLEQIWVHMSESLTVRNDSFDSYQQNELEDTIGFLRNLLFEEKLSGDELEKRLLEVEPFNRFPELIAKMAGRKIAGERLKDG